MKMNSENLKFATMILTEKYIKVQKERTYVQSNSRDYTDFLVDIYKGNHKTYKYILFTALLAKTAFKESIDALSLQEGGGARSGAYDARSLGHKVTVPFERKYLNNALGGSNEPFLNKPARFPTIDKSNSVRAGKDQKKLNLLVDNLSSLDFTQAEIWLEESLNILIDIAEANYEKFVLDVELPNEAVLIKKLFLDLTTENFGGEMLSISLGGLMSMVLGDYYSIEVHKVNQSGSSSKEVGDIDIYLNKELIYSLEAKSKDFALQDVEHAIKKAKSYGLKSFFFIYNHTIPSNDIIEESIIISESNEMVLSILPFDQFLSTILALCNPVSFEILPQTLMNIALEMQLSEDAFIFTKNTLERYAE